MGAVYHALDTTLNVEVAIKENLFTSEGYAEQFRQEARLLASLRHPNLPRVTDYFVIENQGQYLVMDYIQGEDLKTRIEREGKIPVAEAVTIGVALCDALEYLHAQTPPVVHRDIKPGNVRITPEGHVFLVDFGLAKIGGGDQRTVTGAQAVTPGFSPPEQYGTSHTAPHSDIYSLGATLYMALCGEPPPDAFERALDQAEIRPVDECNPEVPTPLASIITTAMALQPGDRFRSATEMKQALLSLDLVPNQQQHLQDHQWKIAPAPALGAWRSTRPRPERETSKPVPPPPGQPPTEPPASAAGEGEPEPPQPASGRRKLRVALWMALILALLAGWYRLDSASLHATVEQGKRWSFQAASWSMTRVAPYLPTGAAALHLAAATNTPLPTTLLPTAQTSPTPSPSPPPTATASPTATATFTPSPTITPTPQPTPLGGSGELAFAIAEEQGAQIWLADTEGHLLQQLIHRPGGACQPAWAPDGRSLAFTAPCKNNQTTYHNAQIYLLHLETGTVDELVPPDWGGYDPAFSPDGRYLAFTSQHEGTPRIYLLTLSNHAITPLTANDTAQPAWSPDGRLLAYTDLSTHRIWLLPFDPQSGTPGEAKGFSHSGSRRNSHPLWAGNGQVLIYTQIAPDNPIPYLVKSLLSQNGLRETPILLPELASGEATASPDGRWLAFEGWKNATNHDIYLTPIDGSEVIQVTASGERDFDPAWRPRP